MSSPCKWLIIDPGDEFRLANHWPAILTPRISSPIPILTTSIMLLTICHLFCSLSIRHCVISPATVVGLLHYDGYPYSNVSVHICGEYFLYNIHLLTLGPNSIVGYCLFQLFSTWLTVSADCPAFFNVRERANPGSPSSPAGLRDRCCPNKDSCRCGSGLQCCWNARLEFICISQ